MCCLKMVSVSEVLSVDAVSGVMSFIDWSCIAAAKYIFRRLKAGIIWSFSWFVIATTNAQQTVAGFTLQSIASLCELTQHLKPFFIHLSSLVLWSWQSQRNFVFSFECKQTPFRWWKCATRHSFSFLFSLWSIALSILLIINALSCAVYKLLMNEHRHVDWAQQMQKAKWDWRRHFGSGSE